MHEYNLILKGTNKELAKYEFKTLWVTYFKEEIKLTQIHNKFYIFKSKNQIEPNHKLTSRLTLTNKICIKLFTGNFKKLNNEIENLDFSESDNKTFAIKTQRLKKDFNVKLPDKELAKPIFDSIKNPKVKIDNPDYEYNFFFENEEDFILTKKIYENDKTYLRRMPKLRPVVMPYTLKSDIARASVNLLGIKDGKVLDPFCGLGGILLEAYEMGFEIIGNDISWNDLKYFKQNFDYFYPNAKYIRILANSKTQFLKTNSIDGIVCDIPYGRACRKIGDNLYEEFLKSAKQYLKPNKRLVIIYADFVEFKNLALKYFDEIKEINQYINKSMTRHILILKNNK